MDQSKYKQSEKEERGKKKERNSAEEEKILDKRKKLGNINRRKQNRCRGREIYTFT